MKKLQILLIFVTLSMLLSSCGGLQSLRSIHAQDILNNQKLSIKMRVRNASFGSEETTFSIGKDIEELADEITTKDPSLSTTIYQNKYILVQTDKTFFLLKKTENIKEDKKKDTRYTFFSPIGTFDTSLCSTTYMYIPYHLISGIDVQYYSSYDNPYPKTLTCETTGTIDEFYEFYSHIAYCEVEKDDNRLTVTSEKNECTMEVSFSQDNTVTFSIIKVHSYTVQNTEN